MRGRSFIFLLLSFLLLNGCERKIKSPTSPDEDFFVPPTPRNIVLKVGDQRIDLSWEISDTTGVGGYKIYRADSGGVNPTLYDSTFNTQYTDRSVRNGQEYFYQLSAVDTNGFEGYKSRIVSASPNLYGIIINENRELTNSLNVSLRLIAPISTSYMMLGNDSLFSNSPWENFSPSRSWVLEAGDGEKTVYVKYKDKDGNESSDFYQDRIILDAQPEPVLVSLSQSDSITLRISWSQNHDSDFDFYQIFRVDTIQGITDITSIAIINQQTTTSYSNSQLKVGTKYCYYIQVHDTEGLVSESNKVCWILQ